MTQLLGEVFEMEIIKHSEINMEANIYVLTESKGLWGRTVFQHVKEVAWIWCMVQELQYFYGCQEDAD